VDAILTYRLLQKMSDESAPYLIAPVAEYKGAAIIERPGNVPKVYRGHEYTSDGFAYLLHRKSERPGYLSIVQFSDERSAKEALDIGPTEQYMSMEEVCKMLHIPQTTKAWEWNEEAGCFEGCA